MSRKLKECLVYLSVLLSLLAFTPSVEAKAFFNPNPPPAVYNYNTQPGTNFYTPPQYVPPSYSPPAYNYSPYYYNSNRPLITQPGYFGHPTNRGHTGPFFYTDPYGNFIWVQPNK